MRYRELPYTCLTGMGEELRCERWSPTVSNDDDTGSEPEQRRHARALVRGLHAGERRVSEDRRAG